MTDYEESADVDAQINDTETTEVEQQEVEQKEDKRPSSVVKLLKQRNELKKEVETLRATTSETEKLAKKVAEMEEMLASQTLDQEAKQQKTEFFTKNPQAKEYETEIDKLVESKWLSQDEAFKLYAATNKPELLVDEQYRNKSTSTANLTWVTKEVTTDLNNPESIADFKSDKELEDWMNRKEAESRKTSGYTN